MQDLTPIALFAAFVVVGVAAWWLGARQARRRALPLPRDYYVGLDHLVNERLDHAVDVLTRMAQRDGDIVELQLALGSLFRRRGEFDRATELHTRLRDHATQAVRERARFELARDYLAAGLMDRAERSLLELKGTADYHTASLEQLLRLYEQQGDWASALNVVHELPDELRESHRRVAAHYLCELAEQALACRDTERAAELAERARQFDASLARTDLLAARIDELRGDDASAVNQYTRVVTASPALRREILPRLASLEARAGAKGATMPLSPSLADAGEAADPYRCAECGLQSQRWYWRCPSCRTWDSLTLETR